MSECTDAQSHNSECRHAECRYSECRCAECPGTLLFVTKFLASGHKNQNEGGQPSHHFMTFLRDAIKRFETSKLDRLCVYAFNVVRHV